MRLRRTELTTPGSSTKMMEKAADSDADEVMIDLEDAVAPTEKVEARQKIVEAIRSLDWGGTNVAVRINGLHTQYAYGDLTEVVESVGERIDTIIVPKITCAEDVYLVETLLDQIEANVGIDSRIGIEVLIEETEAVVDVDEIAATGTRLEALIFGPADYAASQGVDLESVESGEDIWHHVRSEIVVAARSNGIAAIDGPFSDFSDPEGYREECRRAKALGYTGKWTIHPSQIEIANNVFSPTETEVEQAQRLIDAMEAGEESGQGAVELDGKMIDAASARRKRRIVERAKQIGMLD